MSQRRHSLLKPGSHIIGRDALSAYLEAAQYDVLHDESFSSEEKVAALHALAKLTRDLGDHWQQTSRYFGVSGRRVWHRQAGLNSEGMPHPDLLLRVAEVEPPGVVVEIDCGTPDGDEHRE